MRTINLDRIADRLHARSIPAMVQQTGGGVATLFAGTPSTLGESEHYPIALGPGWFDGPGYSDPRADDDDLYLGPDGDSDAVSCKGWTDESIIDTIAATVVATYAQQRGVHDDLCAAFVEWCSEQPPSPTSTLADLYDLWLDWCAA